MKRVYPRHDSSFSCIGGACRHSCCIGWEIDIDEESLEAYGKIPGKMGERLRKGIFQDADGAHFLLTEEERCPFLNEQGLCDLIIELGEDSLCQICADHPRFRNFFSDRTEIGLGLCCEEACRLLLKETAPFSLLEEGEEQLSREEEMLLALRKELFEILQSRSLPLALRLTQLLERCHVAECGRKMAEWAEIFLSLERLDEAWTGKLLALAAAEGEETLPADMEIPLEQLSCYFLYRHLAGTLEDGDMEGRIAFIVLSVRLIAGIFHLETQKTPDTLAEIARLYSSEIEYSDENMQVLMDAWFEE